MDDFQCYLFDVDGTLANTTDLISTAIIKTIKEKKGENIRKREIDKTSHLSPKKILKQFGIDDLKAYWKFYDRNIHLASLFFPETKKILIKLKSRNIHLGIVSSLPKSRLNKILNHLSILDLFEVLVGWQFTVPRKPSPHPIILALKEVGISNSKSMYLGDTEEDVIAAKRAGVYSVCVGWSKMKNIEKFNSDIIINHLDELLNF
ncbi:HAD family hydrolase [Thermodesulfobacteriota bacterium]